jgi:sulfate transport system permease protein
VNNAPQKPGRSGRVIPGFGLSLGYTLTYLTLVILIPLAAVFMKASTLSFAILGGRQRTPRCRLL